MSLWVVIIFWGGALIHCITYFCPGPSTLASDTIPLASCTYLFSKHVRCTLAFGQANAWPRTWGRAGRCSVMATVELWSDDVRPCSFPEKPFYIVGGEQKREEDVLH